VVSSDGVLEAMARALQIDEAERSHLFDLAGGAQTTTGTRRRPAKQRIRPGVQRILDAMNGRAGLRTQRALGHPCRQSARLRPLFPLRLPGPALKRGAVRLSRSVRRESSTPTGTSWPARSWRSCDPKPAVTRTTAGFSDLVGELSTKDETFRTKWAAHNVRFHDTGVQRMNHPVVGELELSYETMELSVDTGLTMCAFTADTGSKSEQALKLLASWAATPDQVESARATDRP